MATRLVTSARPGRAFVIKALRVGDGFEPESASHYKTAAVLLDAFSPDARGGTGRRFDWGVAQETSRFARKLFLAGGITPENVGEAITWSSLTQLTFVVRWRVRRGSKAKSSLLGVHESGTNTRERNPIVPKNKNMDCRSRIGMDIGAAMAADMCRRL